MYTKTKSHTTRNRANRLVSAGCIAFAVLLAACGGPAAAGAGTNAEPSEADKTRAAEAWQECLAKEGIGATISADGSEISIDQPDGMDEATVVAFEAECEPLLEIYGTADPVLSPEEQAVLADGMVEVERCLTEQGYDVTVTPEGDISIGVESTTDSEAEPVDEAAYHAAEQACIEEALPDLWAKYGDN